MGDAAIDVEASSLSLADVLEAREAYHVHLIQQRNVVATAVGRYLFRVEEDERSASLAEKLAETPGVRPPKTLENTRVRPDSWPCVLVFVDHWMDQDEIAEAPDEMVPRRLYLPDGRSVPTCVVYAPPAGDEADPDRHLSFPSELFGGGYVCLSEVQERQRVGSIGCLVSDGLKVYALTNRHVAGEPGTPLFSMVEGALVPLGHSAARSVGRLPFDEAYPGFAGKRMEVAVDAGLIEVDDVRRWTTQVFGVGAISELVDVAPESLALDVIGLPVRAFGAASGQLRGELTALFYRYRTRSGIEYVADAVVGPRAGDPPLRTRPGDSGTLWVLEPEASSDEVPAARPLALQWGGERFASGDGGDGTPYALVSFVSTVCRALDVEPVYDWNADHELYWGEVGHYTIGARACDLVDPAPLRAFFEANRERISFDLQAIEDGQFHTDADEFFHPLADVPDRVWKLKRKGIIRPRESPNHFADMDQAGPDGSTLLSLAAASPANVNPATWIAFYRAIGVTPRHMGLLPFRVAQLYRWMVDSLGNDHLTDALAAGGVMAHYVGDACQPLHASHLHDGENESDEGVHSAYETKMLDRHRAELIGGLDHELAGAAPRPHLRGHREAALAVVELMQRCFERLPPQTILAAYRADHDADELWNAVGAETVLCIADGCRTLAMLWSSAWDEAGAAAPAARGVGRDDLRRRYLDHSFVPSLYLPELEATGFW